MTFKGKTVVSVSFGANIEGIPAENKNIDVLFADNTTMSVKYSQIINQISAAASQIASLNSLSTDLSSLRDVCKASLGFS